MNTSSKVVSLGFTSDCLRILASMIRIVKVATVEDMTLLAHVHHDHTWIISVSIILDEFGDIDILGPARVREELKEVRGLIKAKTEVVGDEDVTPEVKRLIERGRPELAEQRIAEVNPKPKP